MRNPDPSYVEGLATQLRERHPSLLDTLQDDLAILRVRIAIVATFIHNPDYDETARRALAQALHLPEPATPKGQTTK